MEVNSLTRHSILEVPRSYTSLIKKNLYFNVHTKSRRLKPFMPTAAIQKIQTSSIVQGQIQKVLQTHILAPIFGNQDYNQVCYIKILSYSLNVTRL